MDDYVIADRPSKRRRISYESRDRDLEEKRHRNDLRLKSHFESIFEKYGKDFAETADEIDLETGQIVVDRGHLLAMTDETDTGHTLLSSSHQLSDYCTAAEERDEQETDYLEREEDEELASSSADELNAESIVSGLSPARDRHRHKGPGRPSLKFPVSDYQPNGTETKATAPCAERRFIRTSEPAIELAWQVPPLPTDRRHDIHAPEIRLQHSGEMSRKRSPSPDQGSLWASAGRRGRSNRWTREEDNLLRHLRTTTNYTFLELQHYFPERSKFSIAVRWSQKLGGSRANHPHSCDSPISPRPSTKTGKVAQPTHQECSPSGQSKPCKPLVIESEAPIPSKFDSEDDLEGQCVQRKTTSQPWHESVEKHQQKLSDAHTGEASPSNARKLGRSASGLQSSFSETHKVLGNSSGHCPQPARKRSTLLSLTSKPRSEKMKPNAQGILAAQETPPAKDLSNKYAPVSRGSIRTKDNRAAINRESSSCTALPKQKSPMISSQTPKALTLSSPVPSKHNPQISRSSGIRPLEQKPRSQSRSLLKTPSEVDKHPYSDSCELGLDLSCHASLTTPEQDQRRSMKTPLPLRPGKRAISNAGGGSRPQPTQIDEGSEDELSTPIKTVGAPQNLLVKAVGSKRRKISL
ncbi:MAG: hypothetical protein Q9191_007581 [Dirinaria sp. TL-2023a]